MPQLSDALRAWQTAAFEPTLKAAIARLGASALPLARAVEPGSYVGDAPVGVTFQRAADAGDAIEARLGLFFTEIVASCGCGAEPMARNAYCQLRVRIAKATAEASFALIVD